MLGLPGSTGVEMLKSSAEATDLSGHGPLGCRIVSMSRLSKGWNLYDSSDHCVVHARVFCGKVFFPIFDCWCNFDRNSSSEDCVMRDVSWC